MIRSKVPELIKNEVRMPKDSASTPPKRGPKIPPQILADCITPMPMPILFLGIRVDINARDAGHRPAAKPWNTRTKNSWKGVVTRPPIR